METHLFRRQKPSTMVDFKKKAAQNWKTPKETPNFLLQKKQKHRTIWTVKNP